MDLRKVTYDLINYPFQANLAVESFPVREGFGGVTCVWYSAAARRLHCTTTNRTVAPLLTLAAAAIHASVQVRPRTGPLL